MINLRLGQYGIYYGSFYDESETMTQGQMEGNAEYIFSYLTDQGWTRESIAAILGNMQAESAINPGRWEGENVGTGPGYSLVQWTPYTNYTLWCEGQGLTDPSEMDNALARIIYELEHGLQWISTSTYKMSFREFTQSTEAPATLAAAFLLNYERPADQSQAVRKLRGDFANAWFTYLTGEEPRQPSTAKTKRKKFNFILFGKKTMEVNT